MEQITAALAASLGPNVPPGVLQLLQLTSGLVQPLDVHIASPGGVGSTALSTFLTRHGFTTNLLTDTDGMRHSPHPPAWCVPGSPTVPHPGKPRRVVYVYGDPYEVVCSHYRRGHAYHQACKTCGNPSNLGPAHNFPPTPEEYFARGHDLFGLEAHYEAWRQGALAYEVLMLRYDSLWEPTVALPLFHALCGHKLSEAQVQALAQDWVASKAPRDSQVPPSARQSGMYDSLLARMRGMPGLLAVPPRAQPSAEHLQAAQAALHQQLLDQLAGLGLPRT